MKDMMVPEDAARKLLLVLSHDERCGGYGGWWTSELDGGAVGWSVHPDDEDDGVGYAMCECMEEGYGE